jgi:hypothetical protein
MKRYSRASPGRHRSPHLRPCLLAQYRLRSPRCRVPCPRQPLSRGKVTSPTIPLAGGAVDLGEPIRGIALATPIAIAFWLVIVLAAVWLF